MQKILFILLGFMIGTFLLIIFLSVLADYRFNRNVRIEATSFLSQAKNTHEIVTEANLLGLPGCVQRWLRTSGVVGKEKVTSVRLRQKGLMRLEPDKPWMPVEAEQYFTVDKPGFIWKAKIQIAPFVFLTGKDKYDQGKGNMLIKLLALYPIVNATGKELDQGTLLRYLAESAWFPSAALSDYIKWEEIDAHSARATMSYNGISAYADFTFNEKGEVVKFIAKRYMERNGKYELHDWSGVSTDYKEFSGFRIPTKTNVNWTLDSGEFNWFKCEITDIEYNKPEVY